MENSTGLRNSYGTGTPPRRAGSKTQRCEVSRADRSRDLPRLTCEYDVLSPCPWRQFLSHKTTVPSNPACKSLRWVGRGGIGGESHSAAPPFPPRRILRTSAREVKPHRPLLPASVSLRHCYSLMPASGAGQTRGFFHDLGVALGHRSWGFHFARSSSSGRLEICASVRKRWWSAFAETVRLRPGG